MLRTLKPTRKLPGTSRRFVSQITLGLSDPGQALTASSLMASSLKGEERCILEWNGEGPLTSIYAEASRSGEVRGFVSNPQVHIDPLQSRHFMQGTLRVTNIIYNQAKPVTSTVEIKGGDVSSDLMHYFTQVSEPPTYLVLDVLQDQKNSVIFSGGILIEAFPQPNIEDSVKVIQEYNEHLLTLPPLHTFFNASSANDTNQLFSVLKQIVINPQDLNEETAEKFPVDFYCRCAREKLLKMLKEHQSADQLKQIVSEGDNEFGCQYCGKKYRIELNDL